MWYQGNTAYQLDAQPSWEAPARRSLRVHEGGRRATRTATPAVSVRPLLVVLGIVLVLLGAARVALTALTVQRLCDVDVAESNVQAAYDTRTQLQVERSLLSSADRIQGIATQNYGMVLASEVDTVTVASDASADDAQTAHEGFTWPWQS